jgi:hypothetical protein
VAAWLPYGYAQIVVDATLAHTGKGAALFSGYGPCDASSLVADVTIPTPVGAAGPALKLWYKTSDPKPKAVVAAHALSAAAGSFALLAGTFGVELAAASAWTQETLCLDPRLAGRPDVLSLTTTAGGGLCGTTYPSTRTVAFDDVELTTDPGCPAR